MKYIVFPGDDIGDRHIGGKAMALKRMDGAGFHIPPWFVVTAEAFYAAGGGEGRMSESPGGEGQMPESLGGDSGSEPGGEIQRALEILAGDMRNPLFAVRSSSAEEDGVEHSFAGQLESCLYVSAPDVPKRIRQVWQSGFSERIIAYRAERGIKSPPVPPAVLVQIMVDPDCSGVAFGADPVSGRRGTAVVGAIYGAGTALVSGESDADTFHVNRAEEIVFRQIADKAIRHRMAGDASRDVEITPWAEGAKITPGAEEVSSEGVEVSPEGVESVPVADEYRRRSCLDDNQVKEIARLVRKAGRHFERPQDIEWAIKDNCLYLLQSRPVTTLAEIPDPDGIRIIWDNSNIAESYSGVTTPLTFSFARGAYESVYREFCRFMRVSEHKINDNDDTFANLLGLIRGRIYYNLINWYKVLALLPGFKLNRRFMEQMMGVKEELPEEIVKDLAKASFANRIGDGLNLIFSMFGLIENQWKINSKIKAFYRRLDEALADPEIPLSDMRPDELAEYYRGLEARLLKRWDAPLINDFLAMIFFGVLGKLVIKWCGDVDGSLHNDLMCGQGGIVSTQPAELLNRMACIAAGDEKLLKLLRHRDGEKGFSVGRLEEFPEFKAEFDFYIRKFGDRCLEELKLESSTLHDNPTVLLRSIGHLAARLEGLKSQENTTTAEDVSTNGEPSGVAYGGGVSSGGEPSGVASAEDISSGEVHFDGAHPDSAPSHSDIIRLRAEKKAYSRIGSDFRKKVFNWVLKNARDRVRDRENLRFERTRVFGRVRLIFLEIGRRFHALGLLDRPRDIFYLETEEILGFIGGTTNTIDLRSLVALRQREFDAFRAGETPPGRLETSGVVHVGNSFERIEERHPETGDELSGIGCCPGIVRAKVQVITDPAGAELEQGRILVAERTDPGWILLFPAASGILVERGSLLSHAAIVSREMCIPSVVAVNGLISRMQTGDTVEMDGSRGSIRLICRADEVEE